jgi:site-specific DNA recombinase
MKWQWMYIKKYKGANHVGRKEIQEEIDDLNAKLARARDMLFDEELEADDFKKIRKSCDEKIRKLETELNKAKEQNSNLSSIDKMLKQALDALSKLNKLYLASDVIKKREILDSIFREMIRFDGTNYRTAKLNKGAELIYLIKKDWEKIKTGSRASQNVLPVKYSERESNPHDF